MTRRECTILIAITEDVKVGNGGPHPSIRWLWLEDHLAENYGGWTIAPGRYHGVWKDEHDEWCEDLSRKYVVDTEDGQRNILEFAIPIGNRFRQRSIRVVVAGEVSYVLSGLKGGSP